MADKAIKNHQLLQQISAQLSSISTELTNMKSSIIQIKGDVTKLIPRITCKRNPRLSRPSIVFFPGLSRPRIVVARELGS